MKFRQILTILTTAFIILSYPAAVMAADGSQGTDHPVMETPAEETPDEAPATESLIESQPSLQVTQPAEALTAASETAAQNTAEAAQTAETEAAVTEAAGTAATEAVTEKSIAVDGGATEYYGVPSGAGEALMRGRRNFRWPVASSVSLSSCFMDPMGHGKAHYAIDIVADYGAPVTAAYDGTVIAVLYNGSGDNGYGNSVVVLHEDVLLADGTTTDLYTRYSHMSSNSVSVGDHVTGGVTEVGRVGGTGSGYEPYPAHLDFQILTVSDDPEGWSVPSRNSIDPYRNELLEIPSGFTASGGADAWCSCCYDYVAYVRSLYAGKAQ